MASRIRIPSFLSPVIWPASRLVTRRTKSAHTQRNYGDRRADCACGTASSCFSDFSPNGDALAHASFQSSLCLCFSLVSRRLFKVLILCAASTPRGRSDDVDDGSQPSIPTPAK
jgi:hypothetical protein